jgi:two-component system response regulator AtoC
MARPTAGERWRWHTVENQTVLLVDDDASLRKVLSALLVQAGLKTLEACCATEALASIERHVVDAVVTDLRMPGMTGMELLTQLTRLWPGLPVVVLTAHGSVELAVEAMRIGAADFMLKPFEREDVLFVVRKALLHSREERPRVELDDEQSPLSASPAMRGVHELVGRAARASSTVLIRGETGTGKERVARAIHQQSNRRGKPFVTLHCAALPESLLESELFGHEKGAFTGASARKPGRVELANGGSLFLDEIGDVPLSTQVKLLRLLQDKSLERLGGVETLGVDVRFIAATHQPLEKMVQQGAFREDLFYRLNVIPVDVPPLRERPTDVALLVAQFAKDSSRSNGRDVRFDGEAVERLSRAPWPGNVRQLENLVERLVVLSDAAWVRVSEVERELAREAKRWPSSAADAATSLEGKKRELERAAVCDALAKADNNRSLAARLLGVSRRTLYNKIDEFGLGADGV